MKPPETITAPPRLKAVQVNDQQYIFRAIAKPAVTHVEAPVAVPRPEPEYLNLGDLDDRTAARLALRCFARDVLNLGRTNKYQEFKQKRWEEQDAAFDMEVGLVQAVRCRLHERVAAHAIGRD